MLPCSGDDLAIPHDPDPSSDNIFSTLGGHLYVHLTLIPLEGGGHVNISYPVLKLMNFGFLLLHDTVEPVNVVAGLFKVLVGDGCSLVYGSDEAIGHGVCSVLEVFPYIHVEYGFSCAR